MDRLDILGGYVACTWLLFMIIAYAVMGWYLILQVVLWIKGKLT